MFFPCMPRGGRGVSHSSALRPDSRVLASPERLETSAGQSADWEPMLPEIKLRRFSERVELNNQADRYRIQWN